MLQVPEVGGAGQSEAWVATVHGMVQKLTLPMKQVPVAHSLSLPQGAPKGLPPASLPLDAMSPAVTGVLPPQAAKKTSIRTMRMNPFCRRRRGAKIRIYTETTARFLFRRRFFRMRRCFRGAGYFFSWLPVILPPRAIPGATAC
jgi:hypothetical protein